MQITCRPDNLVFEANPLRSVLENLLDAGVRHAHACGGNAACSTCRIMILEGSEHCRSMTPAEKKLAQRLDLPVHIRLACQTRITGDVTLQRLVIDSADVQVAQHQLRAHSIGSQVPAAILSASLRGMANFDEDNFPYDIVYTLGRYFTQMGALVQQYQGVLANQSGLRSLALFGLKQPELAVQRALQTGLALLESVAELNTSLRELSYPEVTLTLGIHYGPTILLNIDPQDPQRVSAFGKSVNFATWLESANDSLSRAENSDSPGSGEHPGALNSQLLISAPVYRAAQDHLSQVEPLSVKPFPNAKPIQVYAVHSGQASLLAGGEQATELADTQPTGWLETLREWLRAWSRFLGIPYLQGKELSRPRLTEDSNCLLDLLDLGLQIGDPHSIAIVPKGFLGMALLFIQPQQGSHQGHNLVNVNPLLKHLGEAIPFRASS
jgi:adenylate cyclase